MGIQGLLPQLKSIMAAISVEQLRGQTVAVDTYSWLHKGALSCGDRLCKGIPTSRHIEYCMHRVNLLRHHGVRPILVFDGGLLPIKSDQEMKRARSRKENLERAREHEAAGNSRAAFECYQKAVDITPLIAFELIQVLKQEKVDYIVAPYEADAQMTFLSVNKLVDAIITEDSDLIPFGCSRIIFKMDKFGQGVEFQNTKLEKNRELDFNGFTKQMLLEMCILSGCDYLPSLPGMGVKRAHALIQKLKSHEKVIKHLRYSSVSVPPQYEENFKKAIQAFQYQRVYDPATEDIVHLSGIPDGPCGDMDFLGPWLPQAVAKGIAEGNLDPLTKEPFLAKPECRVPVADKVHPIREYVPANGNRRLDLPVQKNVLTNYFCLASLEAKRKFRAPKVTPKQQILRQSSLANSQTEDSTSPGSTEDTSLPVNNKQASQCCPDHFSCEPPQDDSDNVAPECSFEHLSSDFPLDDSANISLQCCSGYVGSAPSKDPGNVNTKVESNYCNEITTPVDSCLEGKLHLISKPFLVSHMQLSGPALHCIESKMASTNRDVTVRSSYFEAVNRLDYANEGLEILDGKENNCVSGDCVFSGNSARNPRGILKRKLSDLQNVDGETLQPTSLHLSPDDDEEDCDTDPLDAVNTKTEGKFGCNVSHVNKYTGIAEKSMEQFATLISSVRYTGSRASGLRAPLNDVQNTFSARPPRQSKFRCTAKNTAQGPLSWSRFSNKAMDTADSPPDSTFTYKPVAAAVSRLDQCKFTNKAMDTSDGPDVSTFAYKPIAAAVSCLDQSKFTNKAMDTSDGPPDLSTFAYKPMSAAVSRPDWSKCSGTSIKRAGGTPRSNFTCKTRIAAVSPPDQSMFAYTPTKASVSPPDLSTFAYTPTMTNATVKPPDLRTFSFKPMHKSV